ncbi:MAG: Ig-like domain-containing protein [Nanoarchaeota archaeon]
MRKRSFAIIFLVLLSSAYTLACPELSNLLNGTTINENQTYTEYLGNSSFSLFGIAYLNTTLTDILQNKTSGYLNFTPDKSDSGIHTVLLVGQAKDECISTKLATFIINSRPEIENMTVPKTTTIDEGGYLLFNFSINDDDQEHVFAWHLDGIPVSKEQSFSYQPDYYAQGNHELTVRIKDKHNLSVEHTWEIQVNNVNRPPEQIYLLPDFTIYEGTTAIPYRLTEYFNDPDGSNLTFTYAFSDGDATTTQDRHLIVSINQESYVTLTSRPGFIGRTTIRFDAKDDEGMTIRGNNAFIAITAFAPVCGDGICYSETCDTCEEDCGACNGCLEKWICGEWNNCIAGEMQERECKDLNKCRNSIRTPETRRPCPNTCFDGLFNQNEINVDCGGVCPPCPLCTDTIKNGRETDIDCGNGCLPCNDGKRCQTGSDCKSRSCGIDKRCEPASCTDGIKNPGEDDIDCGVACGHACPTCNDGIKNQREEGIDCGMLSCGNPCPTCKDDIKNQGEKDIDCGGPCIPCNREIGTLITFIILGLTIFIVMLIIELKHGFLFKTLRLNNNVLILSFFLRIWRRFRTQNPRFRPQTDETIKKLTILLHGGLDQTDLDRQFIDSIEKFYREVFSLSQTFAQEQLDYKIRDYEIPYFAAELLRILYKNIKQFEQKKYKTALESMRRIEEAIFILKGIRGIL